MNLATFLVDVATLNVLELQVTGDSTVNQEFHQLACVCGCVWVRARNFEKLPFTCNGIIMQISGY